MTLGGRICPYCKKYTAKGDARCLHCNKYLGPDFLAGTIRFFTQNQVWATTLLVSISVVVFFGEVVMAVVSEHPPANPVRFAFGSVPSDVLMRFGAIAFGGEPLHEPWRLICACYIHMSGLHILANMFALFDFGRILEPVIKGPRMIVAYTVTGVLGFVASGFWYQNEMGITAGASGAVFGIQGLVLGQMLAARDPRFQSFLWRTIGYSVIFYYMMRTNQAAHMGGLAVGMLLGYLFGKEKRPWTRDKYFWAAAILCALATVASLLIAHWTYLHIPLEG